MPNRPTKFRLGGTWNYKIKWRRELGMVPPADGYHDGEDQEIAISTKVSDEVMRITTIHEILHAVLGVQYLGVLRLEQENEELLCHSLGKALYQLLADPENKPLIDWLIGVDVQS